jgi:hypothetical protein
VAENNLDGIGRPPRGPGGQQANAEEMLAELVRLVESSGLAPKRPPPPVEPPPVETVPEQSLPDRAPAQPLEMTSPPLSVEAPLCEPGDSWVIHVEPPRPAKSNSSHSNERNGIGLATGRRSGAWTFRVSAVVLASAAVIGSIFWLEQVNSNPPKAPLIAAAQSPTPSPMQPLSNPIVAAASDAGATSARDMTQPAEGKAVSAEERAIGLSARASLENPPPSQDLGTTAIGVAQPTAPPAGAPPAAPVNTPTAAAPVAASPPAASQSLDFKAAPAVSLPPEPTPTATPAPSATDSGVAEHAGDAPLPPVRPAPKATIQAGGVAQRSTPKPESPTRLSSQSGAHAAAKVGATGLAAPQSGSEPLRLGASANAENKAAQAAVEPPAAASTQPEPAAKQPNANPVARAFGTVVGAVSMVAGLIPFAPH